MKTSTVNTGVKITNIQIQYIIMHAPVIVIDIDIAIRATSEFQRKTLFPFQDQAYAANS